MECQDNMCTSCTEAHHRTKLTRHHKVAPYKEIHSGKYDSDIRTFQPLKCETHVDEDIKFYCKNCDELICRECKVSKHEKHSYSSLTDTCGLHKSKVKTLLESTKGKIPSIEQYIAFLAEYMGHVEQFEKKLVGEVEEQARVLHEVVDRHKAAALRQINAAASQELERVSSKKEATQDSLKLLRSNTDYIDKLLKHGTDAEILDVKQLVTDRLTHLAYLQMEPLTSKLSVYFTPGCPSSMEAIFGKLEVINVPLEGKQGKTPAAARGLGKTTAVAVGETVKLIRSFECKGIADTKDIWPTGVETTHDGHVIILDRENKLLKIYSNAGELVREFGHAGKGAFGCPYDVTQLKNGNLAITDYHDEDVKIFSFAGDYLGSLKGNFKYPRGITTMRDGKLVVVDCHNRALTVHHPETGTLESKIEGKGETMFTDPYYVTTNTAGYIIVTDWAAPHIRIFDPQGKYLSNYGTYGVKEDQCLQPYGVCTDQFGYIFVADSQNHRIHLLAPDGKFIRFLITKEHDLWHPMALTIDSGGHLVVTEALGKVKTFKYMWWITTTTITTASNANYAQSQHTDV